MPKSSPPLTGQSPPFTDGSIEPRPGFYKTRLVKGGAWLPARIWTTEEVRGEDGNLLQDLRLQAELGTERVDAIDPPHWPWFPATEEEWTYLRKDLEWCRKHAPWKPIANPTRPARDCKRELF